MGRRDDIFARDDIPRIEMIYLDENVKKIVKTNG